MDLFKTKSLEQLFEEAGDANASEAHAPHAGGAGAAKGSGLHRTLGPVNLTLLGIGAIIGAGIFSLTGTAAADFAGPGIVYSFVIGGVLCALCGLCYAEMAAMIPVAGSAYAYSYATLGEIVAWVIGWDLILEYAFGAVTVSIAWAGYLVSLLKTLGITLPDGALLFTGSPFSADSVTLADGTKTHGIWNIPATLIALTAAGILYRGMKESARVNAFIVALKVTIVVVFVALGWSVANHANWIGNDAASGLASLVPRAHEAIIEGKPHMSFGWGGVLTGAGVVFFAYIGFDALSTTAQECKNPKRDLPIGIFASLIICTTLYILVALVLTGVVPYAQLHVPDPVALGIDHIVTLRGWGGTTAHLLAFLVKMGALLGLTSVIIVMMMGQTRIFYAMAKDGLLPWFSKTHPKFGTPSTATIVTGVFVGVCGGLMPLSLVGELVSIGTLLAFVLVCGGVFVLRLRRPEVHRPFRVPAYQIVAPLGALACLWVMYGLPLGTWLRLLIWLVIGFAIYAFYGKKHSKLQAQASP